MNNEHEESQGLIPVLSERFLNGLFKENPTFVLLLGMCPTLAVTTSAANGLGMGVTTMVVLAMSNLIISALRKVIPNKVRIPAFIVIIASFVTIVELLLKGYLNSLYDSLGIYIPLIVVNCIILGRAESYAYSHPVLPSLFDGIGMGMGFSVALTIIGGLREVLGSGKLFGATVMPAGFVPVSIFVMAPGAFFVLALLTAIQNVIKDIGTKKGHDMSKIQSGCGGNCMDCTKDCKDGGLLPKTSVKPEVKKVDTKVSDNHMESEEKKTDKETNTGKEKVSVGEAVMAVISMIATTISEFFSELFAKIKKKDDEIATKSDIKVDTKAEDGTKAAAEESVNALKAEEPVEKIEKSEEETSKQDSKKKEKAKSDKKKVTEKAKKDSKKTVETKKPAETKKTVEENSIETVKSAESTDDKDSAIENETVKSTVNVDASEPKVSTAKNVYEVDEASLAPDEDELELIDLSSFRSSQTKNNVTGKKPGKKNNAKEKAKAMLFKAEESVKEDNND